MKCGLDDWLAADRLRDLAVLLAVCLDELPPIEPAEPVDTFDDVDTEPGWVVLTEVREFVTRFVWFPSAGLADAVALWIVHTYLLDAFLCTPRLHVRSPIKRSGKSRLLEVLQLLVHRPMVVAIVTPAVVYRSIEVERPTILLDEVDRQLGVDNESDEGDLIAVLNAGFEPGTSVPRMVGQGTTMTVKHFPTYAAVAMAGIGMLPDTIADRCVIVRLERRPGGITLERFRPRLTRPEAVLLARRVAAWATRHAEELDAARPTFPAGMNDRAENMWEPLLAIADVAGSDWGERARTIAVELAALYEREDVDSTLQLRLLTDVHDTWPPAGDRRWSSEIVESLNKIDGSPWSDFRRGTGLTPSGLANILKPFEIRSRDVRIADAVRRGYLFDDFVPTWERYGVIDEQPVDAQAPHTPSQEVLQPLHTPQTQHASPGTTPPVAPEAPVADVAPPLGVCVEGDGSPNGEAPAPRSRTFPTRARK